MSPGRGRASTKMANKELNSLLEQLFGSSARIKLLRFFLSFSQGEDKFFVRELTRKLTLQLNSVRRELQNLENFGLIISEGGGLQKKKYYKLNRDFVLYKELKALFSKSEVFLENQLVESLKNLGRVNLLILTGHFVGLADSPTDMLIVGKLNRRGLAEKIASFEKEIAHEINYTLLSAAEYRYRKDLTDKFLYKIMENKKISLVDDFEHENV